MILTPRFIPSLWASLHSIVLASALIFLPSFASADGLQKQAQGFFW